MYDSVNFHLKEGQFKIENDSFLDGKKTNQVNGRFDIGSSFVSGVRERVKRSGKYYPLISLPERTIGNNLTGKRREKRLEIQISFQKARYETNKYEIGKDDFGFVHKRIIEYLGMAGIATDITDIKSGVLEKLAISKSIILPSYYGTAEQVIKRLTPLNYKPSCKFRYRDYNDGWEGVSVNFHNDVRGFCIYCKYSEIINNGYTLVEKEIKRQVLAGTQPKDIIRFELTLQRKQTLEAVLRRVIPSKKKDFTLNDIFIHSDIAQKLLLEEFDKIYNDTSVAIITLSEMKENKLDYLLRSRISKFQDRVLMAYFVNMTTKIGLSQTLMRAKQELRGGSYDRVKKRLPEIVKEVDELEEITPNLIEFLRSELVKFEPIKPTPQKTLCQPLLIKV